MKQLDMFEELQRQDLILTSQKTCAYAALKRLKVVDSQAIVAGGAPRDWLFDRQAKDLDIYVQGIAGETNWQFEERIALALESKVVDITSTNDYLTNLDNGVIGVFDVLDCYMPIQVIRCDRAPLSMLDTFHCSLSRVYAMPSGADNSLYLTGNWEFNLGKQYKMNMVKKNFDPKYIAKIRAKFPDFTEVYAQ